jgi:hypothetical protein
LFIIFNLIKYRKPLIDTIPIIGLRDKTVVRGNRRFGRVEKS